VTAVPRRPWARAELGRESPERRQRNHWRDEPQAARRQPDGARHRCRGRRAIGARRRQRAGAAVPDYFFEPTLQGSIHGAAVGDKPAGYRQAVHVVTGGASVTR